jgi:hypothetical protein
MFSRSVADPHHFDGALDPFFQSDADPDPVTHQSDKICDHWSLNSLWLLLETLCASKALHVSILSLTLLRYPVPAFDFDADLNNDPAFHSDADPDPQYFNCRRRIFYFISTGKMCAFKFIYKKLPVTS